MPDFTPLFVASRGQPIEFEGQQLHAALHLQVAPGSRLHVLFEASAAKPVQGLILSARRPKHRLTVGDTSARVLVLWRDTSPDHVEVSLPKARNPIPVAIHNVWRDQKYGTTMYGVNAAAMRITNEGPAKWLLECSDGWGTEPHFNDLVARVVVEPRQGGAA